jgi:hypothetical protein
LVEHYEDQQQQDKAASLKERLAELQQAK